MPAGVARSILAILVVAAIVLVMLVTGWADDKASPGTTGRVPVTQTTAPAP